MQDGDLNVLEWGFKGLVGIILGVGGWLWTGLIGDVRKQETDLAAFKLEAQKIFSLSAEVNDRFLRNEARLETSIERIHDRLDEILEIIRSTGRA